MSAPVFRCPVDEQKKHISTGGENFFGVFVPPVELGQPCSTKDRRYRYGVTVMNIVDVALAKQAFARGHEKWQNFDPLEMRRLLLRLCIFVPVLAAIIGSFEIAGASNPKVARSDATQELALP